MKRARLAPLVAAALAALPACGLQEYTAVQSTSRPPVAARLAFGLQPAGAVAGSAMSPPPVVELLDVTGNVATKLTDSVTLTIGANPAGGTLSGATTVVAVGGLATFSNVSIDRAGAGYTLIATSGGLTPVTSQAFDVTAAAAAAAGDPTGRF